MSESLRSFLSGSAGAALIAGVFGLVMWLLNRSAAKRDKNEDQKEAADERLAGVIAGQRMLLYIEIKRLGKEYLHNGYITSEELEDLLEMHKIYHDALDGNGFLDSLMKQVKHLKIDEYRHEEEKHNGNE